MLFSKRLTAGITVLCFSLMFIVSGCAGARSENSGTAATAEQTTAANGEQTEAKAQFPVLGQTLKYDPNLPVNDGKEITIKYWGATMWEDFFRKWTAEYQKYHPNVKFEFNFASFDDHKKKLPIALQSGTGPDFFFIHNSYNEAVIPNAEPYPEDVFPRDQLNADFRQAEFETVNGKLYYVDIGLMTSAIFYNTAMWQEAGLTENDIPKTWDQLVEIAKKLTKRDGAGNILVAGFNINDAEFIWQDLLYQQGKFAFSADGKKAVFNSPEGAKAAQFMYDLYHVHKVGDGKQPKAFEAFANGKAAMMYNWGWANNYFKSSFPDLKFSAFKLPTWDGSEPPAYGRNNGDSFPGVSAKADAAHKAVAFDFIKYMMANDDIVTEFNVFDGQAPAKISCDSRPEFANEPVYKVQNEVIGRTIWPGPVPDVYYSGLQKYIGQGILINKTPVAEALSKADEMVNKDLEPTGYAAKETLYQFADQLKH